jgi:hypothetical protein
MGKKKEIEIYKYTKTKKDNTKNNARKYENIKKKETQQGENIYFLKIKID